MENDQSQAQIVSLLQQNQALLLENNAILKKQEKRAQIGMILKAIWILVLVILPVLLLPYLIAGLTSSLGIGSGQDSTSILDSAKSTQELLKSLQ